MGNPHYREGESLIKNLDSTTTSLLDVEPSGSKR